MDTEDTSPTTGPIDGPTDEAPPLPPPPGGSPPSPEPTAPAQGSRPPRMWPASTVIAAAIALALFSGLVGGLIGLSVASHHDRVGMVGFQEGLAQRGQNHVGKRLDPGQHWQQFRDNHPGPPGNQQQGPGLTG